MLPITSSASRGRQPLDACLLVALQVDAHSIRTLHCVPACRPTGAALRPPPPPRPPLPAAAHPPRRRCRVRRRWNPQAWPLACFLQVAQAVIKHQGEMQRAAGKVAAPEAPPAGGAGGDGGSPPAASTAPLPPWRRAVQHIGSIMCASSAQVLRAWAGVDPPTLAGPQLPLRRLCLAASARELREALHQTAMGARGLGQASVPARGSGAPAAPAKPYSQTLPRVLLIDTMQTWNGWGQLTGWASAGAFPGPAARAAAHAAVRS